MPGAAARLGAAQEILPLGDVAAAIMQLIEGADADELRRKA
jgi:chemotaxis response regulator CheB